MIDEALAEGFALATVLDRVLEAHARVAVAHRSEHKALVVAARGEQERMSQQESTHKLFMIGMKPSFSLPMRFSTGTYGQSASEQTVTRCSPIETFGYLHVLKGDVSSARGEPALCLLAANRNARHVALDEQQRNASHA